MKEENIFFNNFINNIISSVNVSLLARVESINTTTMIADIKPLKKDLPIIQNVPVAMIKAGDFFIRSNIKSGDIVIVVFSDYSLEGFIDNGSVRDLVLDDRHGLDNAVIVGAIAPLNTNSSLIKDFEELADVVAVKAINREVPQMIGGGS